MDVADQDFQALSDRVAYLEGLLWSLGRLLTGVKQTSGSTGSGVPPTGAQLDSVAAALGTALSGRGTTCPPWCNIDDTTSLNRPLNWPVY